jgi:hypothetical protein
MSTVVILMNRLQLRLSNCGAGALVAAVHDVKAHELRSFKLP